MRSRRLIFGLILLTLLAFGLLASAKLRATPKYDRIQVGMTFVEVWKQHGLADDSVYGGRVWYWYCDEGRIELYFAADEDVHCLVLTGKSITRRGPLERLAWLAGWR